MSQLPLGYVPYDLRGSGKGGGSTNSGVGSHLSVLEVMYRRVTQWIWSAGPLVLIMEKQLGRNGPTSPQNPSVVFLADPM